MSEYSDLVLASFPNAYWRCGSTADSSGNANTLTLSGAVTTPQLINEETDELALFFDGTDDSASAADSATLDVGDVFSIEFWIRSDGMSFNDYIIDKGTDGYQVRSSGGLGLSKIRLAKGGGSVMAESTIGLTAGRVYHIVCTKNGATSKIYIDGVDVTVAGTNATIANNATVLQIGRNANSAADYFAGALDEIAIYPTALSLETVRAHYSAGARLVPDKYDVVINGQGYMTADLEEVKAQYGFTSPFVARSNTQGDFGDNFQDFWLTATQRDFRLGQYQRFFRVGDLASESRYWEGSLVEHDKAGQVKIGKARIDLTFAENVELLACAQSGDIRVVGVANVWHVHPTTGAITDQGAHAAGSVVARKHSAAWDGSDTYIGGATDLRKWNGTVYTTFNAGEYRALAYLNNSLYGLKSDTGVETFDRFDTAGAASVLHTWKNSAGGHLSVSGSQLVPFGSKMLIVKYTGDRSLSSLWIYDGIGVSMVGEFPASTSFSGGACVVGGVAYIGAMAFWGTTTVQQVWFYTNGTLGLLWEGEPYLLNTTGGGRHPFCANAMGGVVWTDGVLGKVLCYAPGTGGIRNIGSFTASDEGPIVGGHGHAVIMIKDGTTTGHLFSGAIATSGWIKTSLFDFNSSLTKIMRGIKVEWDAASDGDGGSVDIAYRMEDLDGSYTALRTGAVSGTEYQIGNATGRAISVQVTLNKGTSTLGPKLKRISVRAVPRQAAFRKGTVVLACWGRDGESPLELRDKTFEPKEGQALATLLNAAAETTSPIAITDQFGTLGSAVIDVEGYQLRQIRPNEYIAVVPYREV